MKDLTQLEKLIMARHPLWTKNRFKGHDRLFPTISINECIEIAEAWKQMHLDKAAEEATAYIQGGLMKDDEFFDYELEQRGCYIAPDRDKIRNTKL